MFAVRTVQYFRDTSQNINYKIKLDFLENMYRFRLIFSWERVFRGIIYYVCNFQKNAYSLKLSGNREINFFFDLGKS